SPASAARPRPIEPILLARLADDALRVDADPLAAILVGIFVLRIHVGETGLDGVELVGADAPIQDLHPAGFGIEAPGVALVHERDRERKIIASDDQRRVVAVGMDLVLFVVGGDELLA